MIISTTNIASTATITATPDSTTQDINVIADGDFSSVYTDAIPFSTDINFAFPVPVNIGYIAIAGSNVATKDSIDIEFDSVPYSTIALASSESNVLMIAVDQIAITELTITINGTGTLSISEIAMGDYYEVTRGEQGGYRKAWTVPNIATRSATNLQNTPININYESRALSITLSEPNNIMSDFGAWYKMINFAARNTFYISEDSDPTHSYAGFNAVPAITAAHAQKGRKLGVSGITFNAFAKSNEGLF